MINSDPTSYPLLTYAWVVTLSVAGGICRMIIDLRRKKMHFSLMAGFGDIFVSIFVGLVTFYLCEASSIRGPFQAALVSVSAHMGSRSIFMIEQYINRSINQRFGIGQDYPCKEDDPD